MNSHICQHVRCDTDVIDNSNTFDIASGGTNTALFRSMCVVKTDFSFALSSWYAIIKEVYIIGACIY